MANDDELVEAVPGVARRLQRLAPGPVDGATAIVRGALDAGCTFFHPEPAFLR